MRARLHGLCTRAFSVSAARRAPHDVVLLGSDEFSIAALEPLLKALGGPVVRDVRVVTMPDRMVGRSGKELSRRPLRTYALANQLPCDVWEATSDMLWLNDVDADSVLLTASFGALVPDAVLDRFPRRAFNVHPSLLPRYRGAAPIQWSIMNADAETGVTVQEMSRGVFDRGAILAQQRVPMPPLATYGQLAEELGRLGGELALSCLADLDASLAAARPQEGEGSRAPKITREHRCIRNWREWSADRLLAADRALHEPHGPMFGLRSRTEPFQFVAMQPDRETEYRYDAGFGAITYDSKRKLAILHCVDDTVALSRVRPASCRDRRGVPAQVWWEQAVVAKGAGNVFWLECTEVTEPQGNYDWS